MKRTTYCSPLGNDEPVRIQVRGLFKAVLVEYDLNLTGMNYSQLAMPDPTCWNQDNCRCNPSRESFD